MSFDSAREVCRRLQNGGLSAALCTAASPHGHHAKLYLDDDKMKLTAIVKVIHSTAAQDAVQNAELELDLLQRIELGEDAGRLLGGDPGAALEAAVASSRKSAFVALSSTHGVLLCLRFSSAEVCDSVVEFILDRCPWVSHPNGAARSGWPALPVAEVDENADIKNSPEARSELTMAPSIKNSPEAQRSLETEMDAIRLERASLLRRLASRSIDSSSESRYKASCREADEAAHDAAELSKLVEREVGIAERLAAQRAEGVRAVLGVVLRERDDLQEAVQQAEKKLAEKAGEIELLGHQAAAVAVLQSQLEGERAKVEQTEIVAKDQAKGFEDRILVGEQQMDQLSTNYYKLKQAHSTLEEQLIYETTRRHAAEDRVAELEKQLVMSPERTPASVGEASGGGAASELLKEECDRLRHQVAQELVKCSSAQEQVAAMESRLAAGSLAAAALDFNRSSCGESVVGQKAEILIQDLERQLSNVELGEAALARRQIDMKALIEEQSELRQAHESLEAELLLEARKQEACESSLFAANARRASMEVELAGAERSAREAWNKVNTEEACIANLNEQLSSEVSVCQEAQVQTAMLRHKLTSCEELTRQTLLDVGDSSVQEAATLAKLQESLATETDLRRIAQTQATLLHQQLQRFQQADGSQQRSVTRFTSQSEMLRMPSTEQVVAEASPPLSVRSQRRETRADACSEHVEVARTVRSCSRQASVQILPAPTAVVVFQDPSTRQLPHPTLVRNPMVPVPPTSAGSPSYTVPALSSVPVLPTNADSSSPRFSPRFGNASGEVSPRSGDGSARGGGIAATPPVRPVSPPRPASRTLVSLHAASRPLVPVQAAPLSVTSTPGRPATPCRSATPISPRSGASPAVPPPAVRMLSHSSASGCLTPTSAPPPAVRILSTGRAGVTGMCVPSSSPTPRSDSDRPAIRLVGSGSSMQPTASAIENSIIEAMQRVHVEKLQTKPMLESKSGESEDSSDNAKLIGTKSVEVPAGPSSQGNLTALNFLNSLTF